MCTNFALIKSYGSDQLARQLVVEPGRFRYGNDFGPGSTISIVANGPDGRDAYDAVWWLYLCQTDAGLKPDSRYFSVNTRSDKVANKPEFRRSRCIIPATAFVESQDGRNPHLLQPADGSAIGFGGLCKQWRDRATGRSVLSASIITLPGHPALADIHRKSMPLWLPENAFDAWLDEEEDPSALARDFLAPALQKDLYATPIDRARAKRPVGAPLLISSQERPSIQ